MGEDDLLATRRWGSETLVTGIEYFPSARRIAPGGSVVGGGGGVVAVAVTSAVASEVAVAEPSVLRAVTCKRIRRPTSSAVSSYCVPVAAVITVQSEPDTCPPLAGQRSHR